MNRPKSTIPVLFLLLLLLFPGLVMAGPPPQPRNIILLIGDGMGFAQVAAAGSYLTGSAGSLSFEQLPYHGEVKTLDADGRITDSAAAGTAMATGVKVSRGVVSRRIPGDGSALPTILELAEEAGLSSGLVTTTTISHATPAVFAAHVVSRTEQLAISNAYLADKYPEVLMGGALLVLPQVARNAGYRVVKNAEELDALDTETENRVWGLFGMGYLPYESEGVAPLPHLSQMTVAALNILDNDPEGFFLMVEGGRIDHACHEKDIAKAIHETVEFSRAVEAVMSWAAGRDDTLILVTADHETGGLQLQGVAGRGEMPTAKWQTSEHTAQNVPVYAWGFGAAAVTGVLDNTDIFHIMRAVLPASGAEGRGR